MYARMLKKVFLINLLLLKLLILVWDKQNYKKQHSKFQFDPEMRTTGLSALLLVSPSWNKVNLIKLIN